MDADLAVRHAVAALCEDRQWDQAVRLAEAVSSLSSSLTDLATLVDLHRSLVHAVDGDLGCAQKRLAALQKRLASTDR
jgi:hypothetical protein